MADYLTTDTELTSIANAIRLKGGTSGALTYPQDFISAINNIETGGDEITPMTEQEIWEAATEGWGVSAVMTDAQIHTAVDNGWG